MEYHSIERHVVIIFDNLFRPKFFGKKQKFWTFLETDLTLPIDHYISYIWCSFSTNSFAGWITLLLVSLCWQFRVWTIPKMLVDETTSSPMNSWRKQFKTKVFSEDNCSLSHFSGLVFQVWYLNADYGIYYEAFVAFSVLLCPQDLDLNFFEKKMFFFQKDFLKFLKFFAFIVP